jgi:signal transduction histidine kinase
VTRHVRRWWPDAALGVLVASAGAFEMSARSIGRWWIVAVLAVAVGLFRRAPVAAAALLWVLLYAHLRTGSTLLITEVTTALVAYGAARWGRTVTVWFSGLSILALGVLGVWLVGTRLDIVLPLVPLVDAATLKRVLVDPPGVGTQVALIPLGLALVGFGPPWLLGLAVRSIDEARRSRALQHLAEDHAALAHQQVEREREIAELRAGQARLARDVHDVVGHSLAVILAQAQAAAYLQDPDEVRATVDRIADAARRSLQDVRTVLESTQVEGAAVRAQRPPGTLDALVTGLREAGHGVESTVIGVPQPLPPELETVAYRVAQEMLTNAVRHGDRREPVHVEQVWSTHSGDGAGQLRLEVRNTVAADAAPPQRPGLGVDGMVRRLASVGGSLDARLHDGWFVATASLPVRAVLR